jgi:hypothetical protein
VLRYKHKHQHQEWCKWGVVAYIAVVERFSVVFSLT